MCSEVSVPKKRQNTNPFWKQNVKNYDHTKLHVHNRNMGINKGNENEIQKLSKSIIWRQYYNKDESVKMYGMKYTQRHAFRRVGASGHILAIWYCGDVTVYGQRDQDQNKCIWNIKIETCTKNLTKETCHSRCCLAEHIPNALCIPLGAQKTVTKINSENERKKKSKNKMRFGFSSAHTLYLLFLENRLNDKKVPTNHQMLIKNIMIFFTPSLSLTLILSQHSFILCVVCLRRPRCIFSSLFSFTPICSSIVFYTLNSSLCDYDKLFMEKRLSFSLSVSLFQCCRPGRWQSFCYCYCYLVACMLLLSFIQFHFVFYVSHLVMWECVCDV